MHDQPTASELLDAVAKFLREQAMPQLDGHAAFHARVSANALDIVRRELEFGAEAANSERKRLTAILGHEGRLLDLTRELSERIGAGEINLATPGLEEHLWTTTLDKLKVDQPSYASYLREQENRSDSEGA